MTAPCSRGDDDLASLVDGFRRTHQEVSSDRLHFGVIGGKVFERKREESCFELCRPRADLGLGLVQFSTSTPRRGKFFFSAGDNDAVLFVSHRSRSLHTKRRRMLSSLIYPMRRSDKALASLKVKRTTRGGTISAGKARRKGETILLLATPIEKDDDDARLFSRSPFASFLLRIPSQAPQNREIQPGSCPSMR